MKRADRTQKMETNL